MRRGFPLIIASSAQGERTWSFCCGWLEVARRFRGGNGNESSCYRGGGGGDEGRAIIIPKERGGGESIR